jgi:glutathione synthase/RimK-type ligase-like ATP-grasp enzyme
MKVGVLVGRETEFPSALIERINDRFRSRISAEMMRLGSVPMDAAVPYRVIIDRISHEVPFYRAYLEKAVAEGTAVINNPFWWSADDKYFECVLATKLGVAVPRTVIVPNHTYEADIIDESLRNLVQPPPWEELTSYTGLPAVMKPARGGGSKNVTVVRTIDDLVSAWEASGHLQMILQEFIDYEKYVRCFVIGQEEVRVSRFDISLPRHERYHPEHELSGELHARVVRDCLILARTLGYDVDTMEFAIRNGIPYAIDFLNPAPDSDPKSVGMDNFEWLLDRVSALAGRYAEQEQSPPDLRWQKLLDGG